MNIKTFVEEASTEFDGKFPRISGGFKGTPDELKSFTSSKLRELIGEVRKIIEEHNARILNEFQSQGKPDMPMIAYDERICLIPAIEIATKETMELLDEAGGK